MGSGRGDRNQLPDVEIMTSDGWLQWGPVVVTGISGGDPVEDRLGHLGASMGSGRGDRNQTQP